MTTSLSALDRRLRSLETAAGAAPTYPKVVRHVIFATDPAERDAQIAEITAKDTPDVMHIVRVVMGVHPPAPAD